MSKTEVAELCLPEAVASFARLALGFRWNRRLGNARELALRQCSERAWSRHEEYMRAARMKWDPETTHLEKLETDQE